MSVTGGHPGQDARAEKPLAEAGLGDEEEHGPAVPRPGRMPPVFRGRRRALLTLLFLLGVFQAAMALTMAMTVSALLGGDAADVGASGAASAQIWPITVLLLSVVSLAGARWAERVVGEDLGQDYVYEMRRKLIGSALTGGGSSSLGVTVTRASNDLTAVRMWISQGIVPLLTAVPLIAVILVALAVASPVAGAAVGTPVVVLALCLVPLSRLTYRRARELRRRRGRMSGRISDTVLAGESVRAAGAVRRELAALDRDSAKVVGAAVARARATGAVRAAALAAASAATAGIVLCGAFGVLGDAEVASCLTLVGIITTPLSELGRVVEYRQNYKAARRIQAPLMRHADSVEATERRRERDWESVPVHRDRTGRGGLLVEGLVVDGVPTPRLQARAGQVVAVRCADPGRAHRAVAELVAARSVAADGPDALGTEGGAGPEDQGGLGLGYTVPTALIDGHDLTRAPDRVRRRLLGVASARVRLERGSIRRLLSLRQPGVADEQIDAVAMRVGLTGVFAQLRDGVRTRVRHGGEPLTVSQRSRVKLGRALLGDPPLLVVDGLDADLDDDGRRVLEGVLRDYPGVAVVVCSSSFRDRLDAVDWDLEDPRRAAQSGA